MNGVYQHYIIDLSSNNNFVQIPTVQGDGNNIRGFEVELIENGVKYVIDKNDCLVAIMGTKPDTSQIMNDCIVNDEGYILVDITSQMSAVKGRGNYQIVLMSRSTNSQLKSFPFYILTTPTTFDIDYIVSSDEFQALTKNIVRTEEVIENANDAISDIRNLESSVGKAEQGRVDAEKNRVKAEKDRTSAETIRDSNENDRKVNEINRQNAEINRENAETDRATAESIRISNESTRISNETIRESNEKERKQAETNRIIAETNRDNSEAERVNAENIRVDNENDRKAAETTRITAETDRVNEENTRKSNETTRQNNESTRQSNESTRQTNEDTRDFNETNRISAETDRISAEGVRETNENVRIENENQRKTAENCRVTEETKRDNAEKIRIDNESDRQANESVRQLNESDRQTNTAIAISNANEATNKANAAAEKASVAGEKAAAAESTAIEKATEAENYAKLSQSYAVGGSGMREGEDADNAKRYYEQAKAISKGLSGILIPMGTVAFADLPPLSDVDDGWMFNISDQFITDENFKEGANLTIPAGSNVYKTADGKWDILAGSPVTGVKGNNETSYRQGNINITPENIGLGNVPNVSTNNQTPTFTQSSARNNIASGENLSTIMGKIMKWFADLKTVAFSGSYNDLSNKPSIPAAVAVKGNAESAYRTGNVNITPANIGLGNVNNTADSNKSVKYATSAGSANSVAYTNVSGRPTFSLSGTTLYINF